MLGVGGVTWRVVNKQQKRVKVFTINFQVNFRAPTKKWLFCHPVELLLQDFFKLLYQCKQLLVIILYLLRYYSWDVFVLIMFVSHFCQKLISAEGGGRLGGWCVTTISWCAFFKRNFLARRVESVYCLQSTCGNFFELEKDFNEFCCYIC